MTQSLYEQAVAITAEESRLAESHASANLAGFVPSSLHRVASACGEFVHAACLEVPEAPSDHPFWPHLTNGTPTPILNPKMDALPARYSVDAPEKQADRLFIAAEDDVLKVESMARYGGQLLRITRYGFAEGQILSDYANLRMTQFRDFSVFGSSVLLEQSMVEFKRSQGVVGSKVELFRGFDNHQPQWDRMATYGPLSVEDRSETIHATFVKEASTAIDSLHNFVSQ